MAVNEIFLQQKTTAIITGEPMEVFRKKVPPGAVIITDENVRKHYGSQWKDYRAIVTSPGEQHKTLENIGGIYRQLVDFDVDRNGFIVGVGGGIVCDMAGFAASTYLRGIRFGFVATTLLAQCDAAIGGKNGVNFRGFKNMVGTIEQPEFVICDTGLLKTLPKAELANGFAEIVKHALISDINLLDYIQAHVDEIIALQPEAINRVIAHSHRIKIAIVQRDVKEAGQRRKLNYGHTFGHAIEKVHGLTHGKAVSIGMMIAAEISMLQGYLSANEVNRIKELLIALGLPVTISGNIEAVMDALLRDKKRQDDFVHFVLLRKPGKAIIERIQIHALMSLIKQLPSCNL
jgi:3-dehydroquinate synthase